ncbi:hypothetical protein JTE90_007902 [Oedothorax gibbosus]|uniref:Uncharacterized protein n=1 Tax=Oedothorax gibbosus TaxID=931172 RepID=A0AAV6VJU1_9ARAC|nr:hypothetical protein JTE90_007902 [Oedothorax gibbosus]
MDQSRRARLRTRNRLQSFFNSAFPRSSTATLLQLGIHKNLMKEKLVNFTDHQLQSMTILNLETVWLLVKIGE